MQNVIIEDLKKSNRRKHKDLAVFPVKLRILPEHIFNKRSPIVMGVFVEAGELREGTPLCVPSRDCVCLGKVHSIEANHKPVRLAREGLEVCIRIDPLDGETPKMYGRHFEATDTVVSKVINISL
ncbi:unnamed protein product [Protopolystoma xenopodis]|uniref:Elongation factor Tu-type domain-containing protein n=1 Tax=Protopolystoma xenopodis TaxID=117903 RepID=A0A3S5CNN4_9PLAT|nr:unnamed protein product [Protopolystoma xenopodis]